MRIWKIIRAWARKWSTSRIDWRHVKRAGLYEWQVSSESQSHFMVWVVEVVELSECSELVFAELRWKDLSAVRPDDWIERV